MTGLTVDQMWDEALPFPCQRCMAGPGEFCVLSDGTHVAVGNGPHSARYARARGGHSWRQLKWRYGPDLLPGPSPDGEIPRRVVD